MTPFKCNSCGANMKSNTCDYCGTRYLSVMGRHFRYYGYDPEDLGARWARNRRENDEAVAAHPEWFDGTFIPGTGNPSYGLTIQECMERDSAKNLIGIVVKKGK